MMSLLDWLIRLPGLGRLYERGIEDGMVADRIARELAPTVEEPLPQCLVCGDIEREPGVWFRPTGRWCPRHQTEGRQQFEELYATRKRRGMKGDI